MADIVRHHIVGVGEPADQQIGILRIAQAPHAQIDVALPGGGGAGVV